MKILVLNCGSSSIKFQLIDMDTEEVLEKGTYERIGEEGSSLTLKVDGEKIIVDEPTENHVDGIRVIFRELLDKDHGKLKSLDELDAVGHRIVHGGEKFADSVIIDQDVEQAIIDNIPLSPLHNPAGLAGIEAVEEVAEGIPNVAVFDTAFHQTMPEEAYIYNIPYKYYEKYGIRKYGFHGTSHRYISNRLRELLGEDKTKRIISCHIGQGASICAIKDGKSVDTTMGFTPVAGIPMGTRSGDIDVSIVKFLMNNEHLSIDQVDDILNKESGVYGISDVSSDFRDVEKAAGEQNEKAILALKSNAYLTAKAIASYMATLGGVDVIAFAGGVGENGETTRAEICKYLEFAGVKLDLELNNVKGVERRISSDDSKVEVWIIPTNEELMIARDTKKLIENM